MWQNFVESFLGVVRLSSASFFLMVVSGFVFLLLVPRVRLKAYLSKAIVRRFVEYFGNVGLGEEASHIHEGHGSTWVA